MTNLRPSFLTAPLGRHGVELNDEALQSDQHDNDAG
jgi:hypothetical protein